MNAKAAKRIKTHLTSYKTDLLAKIDDQHQALVEIIAGLTAAQAKAARVTDVLAHLTAWEQRMLREIKAIVAARPRPRELKTGAFNEQVDQANRGRPVEQVRSEFDASFQKSRRYVQRLDAEAFDNRLVKALIGFNTHGHYRWATEKIKSRLKA